LDEQDGLVGLITTQDLTYYHKHPDATKDLHGRLMVGAAVGVQGDELGRAERLIEAGADVLVVDIAHGHSEMCVEMVRQLRHRFSDLQIIGGNVATRQGARDLAAAGVDAVKVGVGPGSICTTRVVTGFGVPQMTAISDAAEGAAEVDPSVPVIADGGIRASGDVVKALAAGASTVMVGSLFAGCEEAPGATIIRSGRKYKLIRGMASLSASVNRTDKAPPDPSQIVPEGVDALVPYRGHVEEILFQLVGGLRSGLSYGGARTVSELQQTAEFIEISQAGVTESRHHDVEEAGG
jgi:IMP dehydrogenase